MPPRTPSLPTCMGICMSNMHVAASFGVQLHIAPAGLILHHIAARTAALAKVLRQSASVPSTWSPDAGVEMILSMLRRRLPVSKAAADVVPASRRGTDAPACKSNMDATAASHSRRARIAAVRDSAGLAWIRMQLASLVTRAPSSR